LENKQLKYHIYITNRTLRYGLVTLAVIFPILLYAAMTAAVEAVGIWAFAYYWWPKSQEFAQTDAELLGLRGEFYL
jgi:hypothetical protein